MSDAAVGGKRGVRVRWTKMAKIAFLDELAATCNVTAAAKAIGVEALAMHRKRRSDPAFAAAWARAVDAGYQLLETRLVGCALVLSGATERAEGERAPTRELDFDPAFRILRHREEARGKPVRGGVMLATPPTRDEADRQILAKLAVLAARRARA